jgi:hypothetical protein
MTEIRTIAELLYFLSGVVLATVALFGIQQIKLLKRDIRLRNERASKEKTLEFAQTYESHIELANKFYEECSSKKLLSYDGPVGDFTVKSIPKNFFPFTRKRFDGCWLDAMNRLEIVAAAFISGVADEELGFNIIGPSFCASVVSHYDLISSMRDHDDPTEAFQPIVDLYRLWAPRLTKAQLLRAREELQKRIEATVDRSIPPTY